MSEQYFYDSNASNKELKCAIGKQCRFFLTYQIIFMFVSIAGFFVVTAKNFASPEGISFTDIDLTINLYSGTISLAALFTGSMFVLLKRRKHLFLSDLCLKEQGKHRMLARTFFKCAILMFAAQGIFSVFYIVVEMIANQFGYTSISADNQNGLNITMFVYACVLGPIVEEVVFRGVILTGLDKFGNVFAIITSSIIFGIFHGDIAQGTFAFCCGLILGYVRIKYSFMWALVLHIFNNLVLSEMMSAMIGKLPISMQNNANWLLILLGFIGGVCVLVTNRKTLFAFYNKNKSAHKTYKTAWTSIWFLVCILTGAGMVVTGFSKL